jgi:hypothetical protein
MSRWKAAAIHVSISVLIGLISATLIFFVWYPHPYSHAAGADKLILLLLGVDVVLGPLLTLIVFRAGKWGMRFDLIVIAIAQACAFLYGTSVVVRARPAFVVANIDRFSLVTANDIDDADYAKATRAEFRSPPWTGPRIIGALPPTDIAERNKIVLSGPGGKDIDVMPQYYVDYPEVAQDLLLRAKTIGELTSSHPDAKGPIEEWLRERGQTATEVKWVPLTSHRATLTMLLDAKTGATLDALPVTPW